ncbi:hypothetical protein LXL04_001775 [Taraxacum kok-saghyz]
MPSSAWNTVPGSDDVEGCGNANTGQRRSPPLLRPLNSQMEKPSLLFPLQQVYSFPIKKRSEKIKMKTFEDEEEIEITALNFSNPRCDEKDLISAVIGVHTGVDDFLYACGIFLFPVLYSITAVIGVLTGVAFLLVKQKFTPYSITALYGLVLPMVEMTYNKANQAITYTPVTKSGQKGHMRTILKNSWVNGVQKKFNGHMRTILKSSWINGAQKKVLRLNESKSKSWLPIQVINP